MAKVLISPSGFLDNHLHATDSAVFQHHLDAVRVRRTARKNTRHDSFGQFAAALVLFFDDLHAHAGAKFAAFWDRHRYPDAPTTTSA